MNYKKLVPTLAVSLSLLLAGCGAGEDSASNTNKNNGGDTAENIQKEEQTATPALIAGAPLQDGTYTLNEKDFDKNGWKVQFEITVKDGKITESNYNYVNAEGTLKTEDEGYQEMMSGKTGVGPQDFVPALNNQLIDTQDAQQIEVVSGATHSSEAFMNYAQQLIQAAQKGDTALIEIDAQAAMQDGVYSLTEKNLGNTGWKHVIKMTVADGKISNVEFDNVNGDGLLKSEDEEYQAKMSEIAGVGPQDFLPALAQSLIDTQDAAGVEVVSGATHTSHSFKIYAAQLINAAQKGDTTPIEVDNFVFEKQ